VPHKNIKNKKKTKASNRLSLIIVILLLTVFLALFYTLNFWLSSFKTKNVTPESSLSTPTQETVSSTVPVSLSFSSFQTERQPNERFFSFSDLFSNTAYIDEGATNLTYDVSAMVFTFAPHYTWQELGSCSSLPAECGAVDRLSKEQVYGPLCRDPKHCLSLETGQILYNGKKLALPTTEPLINFSLGLFGQRWLIGGVKVISEKEYEPVVWWFDGANFEPLDFKGYNDQAPRSPYRGYLAFGGWPDNIFIVYSAKDGLAWQVRGQEIIDLSRYFSFRVNNGGFEPSIIGAKQSHQTVWYVFDHSASQPRLLKYWQNENKWIEGSLDLSSNLPTGTVAAIFSLEKAEPLILRAKIINQEGEASLWLLKDDGFIAPSSTAQVTSVDLTGSGNSNSNIQADITGVIVAELMGGWSGFKEQILLSPDGQKWLPIKIGERFDFTPQASHLFWRWQVEKNDYPEQSPCLKKININYFRK